MTEILSRWRLILSGIAACFVQQQTAHAAAWWYEQAERLQLVSATLLDGPPISEPVPNEAFVAGRMLTSLLPKPNPKVGSKQEKVPAAPVHAVPTLVGGAPLLSSGRYSLLATSWAGYLPLPVSIAKIIGVNASLSQYIVGASAENIFRLDKMFVTTSLGFQYGGANLDGAITAADAKDTFKANTTLIHISQGIAGRTIPLWANGMIIVRRSTSKFYISAEKTEFLRNDNMSDAQVPLAAQLSLGGRIGSNLQVALSEYLVPDRLIMPRLSLIYQYTFSGKKGNQFEPDAQPSTAPRKRPSKRKKPKRPTTFFPFEMPQSAVSMVSEKTEGSENP